MRAARNPDPVSNTDGQSDDHRRAGRIKCDYLYCRHGRKHFGQIIDLSKTGMRVVRKAMTRLPKGAQTELILCWHQAQVPVWTRVAWERKIGLFTHLLGMEFINVTPDVTAVILSLANKARTSLVIANVEHDFSS